jgi:hypothetical protein
MILFRLIAGGVLPQGFSQTREPYRRKKKFMQILRWNELLAVCFDLRFNMFTD